MLTATVCETIKDIPALVAFTDEVVGAGTPSAVLDVRSTQCHGSRTPAYWCRRLAFTQPQS
jgi:hypothetical protein